MKQYHLIVNTSIYLIGKNLFPLPNTSTSTNLTMKIWKKTQIKVILFLSKHFIVAET